MQRFFKIFFMAFAILHATSSVAQDTLWFHVPDRFTESDFIVINQFDSIQFRKNSMYFYYKPELGKTMPYTVRTYSSKYDYYTMHNRLVDLGISVPPELKNLNAACGWGKKCVDVMVEHSKFDGFTVADPDAQEMLDSLAARYGEAACQKLLAGRGEGMTMSVTYYPQINEFRGVSSLQIVIQNYIC